MAKEAMVPAASAIQPKMNTGSLSVFSDAEKVIPADTVRQN